MNIRDLKPAAHFAQRYGVKILAYGAPGSGKTPVMKTAPSPVLLLIENGAGSLADATNIPAWDGTTVERADEFFKWVTESAEAKAFDTICIDSLSQYCNIVLAKQLKAKAHGLQAYGEMARITMQKLNSIYFMSDKHLYAIAQQVDVDIAGTIHRLPSFPGKALSSEVPHLFDTVLHAEKISLPKQPKPVPAFRCTETFGILARDRYGKLNEFEPMDLAHIIAKSMG